MHICGCVVLLTTSPGSEILSDVGVVHTWPRHAKPAKAS